MESLIRASRSKENNHYTLKLQFNMENNREIKFRAWNKKEQAMFLSPDTIQHLGFWFDAHLPGALADLGNIVIMQFTGLLDSKGNEIYEGDIVTKNGRYTDVVKYDFYEVYPFTRGGLHGSSYYPEMCEVIGNIHENPELLK